MCVYAEAKQDLGLQLFRLLECASARHYLLCFGFIFVCFLYAVACDKVVKFIKICLYYYCKCTYFCVFVNWEYSFL